MICCAYVSREGVETTPNSLREHLKKLVPNYMFPVRWMPYDTLPKNANGKIDRPRLKERFLQNEKGQSGPKSASTSSGDGTSEGSIPTLNRAISKA
jgi:acyl-CoA synthetase (AMP-forming)/AMP-acid ligase II